jgi:hypothetical protein
MLALTLVAMFQATECLAQPSPVMGYVAAKNANPKRLEVFGASRLVPTRRSQATNQSLIKEYYRSSKFDDAGSRCSAESTR